MSLTGAFQIGSSALTASQLAIQVAGNNLANAATPGYSRQLAFLSPARSDVLGRLSIGTGVQVDDVQRQVDQSLQARLYGGISAESAANQQQQILSQVESALGGLGQDDLTDNLNKFFNSWRDRANNQQTSAVVVTQGQSLARFIQNMRSTLVGQQQQLDNQLSVSVTTANGLFGQIADLNKSISEAEAGGGQANALRDQRDQLITQLSQYMDVSTVQHANGSMDVLVGSTPVVLGGRSRGVQLQSRNNNGTTKLTINLKEDGQTIDVRGGQVGSIMADRGGAIPQTIDKLDALTEQLIFQVNRIHSTGTTANGLTTTTGTLGFAAGDRTKPLSDPTNLSIPGGCKPNTGDFTVVVKSAAGATQSVTIHVDMDGRTSTGAIGTSEDTSLQDIQTALNAVPGLSAQITPDGKLKIDAAPGSTFSFSDDTSGVLATLGVNSFFTGTDASNIDVRADLQNNSNLLATGRMDQTGAYSESANATLLANLQDTSIDALGGKSLKQSWSDTALQIGTQSAAAKSTADAASAVRQNLDAQRSALSGVSVDEESVNLLTFQRQYQGAAKYISIVDEMTQTLISLV